MSVSHVTELTCQYGRRKSGALLGANESLKQDKAEAITEGLQIGRLESWVDVYY